MSRTKRIALGASALVLTLALVEGILLVARTLSPDVDRLLGSPWDGGEPSAIDDPDLIKRPNPRFPEHDKRGFRNPAALASADIVALGDSQTYGTGVASDKAWPQALARESKLSVYGMALGGYGPVHSLILWPEALSLQPKTIIEAFYFGNDLFDSFDLVYAHGRHDNLKSGDRQVLDAVSAAERNETLTQRVERAFLVRSSGGADQPPVATGSGAASGVIAKYSGLYGLARRIRFELQRGAETRSLRGEAGWQAQVKFAEEHADYSQIFSDNEFRTIFMSEYRLLALDRSDIRIAEGLRLSLEAIGSMHDLAKSSGVRFVVLMIPTKETVFAKRWHQPTEHFGKLIEAEAQVRSAAVEFFRQHGIEFVDAAQALQGELEKSAQPYPESWDGHPNEIGHAAIAHAVAEYLSSTPLAPVNPRQ